MNTYVFYAGLLHSECFVRKNAPPWASVGDIPDGAYIYFSELRFGQHWYRSDYTPVLLSDVPKELLALVLLLT